MMKDKNLIIIQEGKYEIIFRKTGKKLTNIGFSCDERIISEFPPKWILHKALKRAYAILKKTT